MSPEPTTSVRARSQSSRLRPGAASFGGTRRLLVSLVLAAVLLTVLMLWGGVTPADLARALGRLTPATYLTALALHVSLYLLRTWRFAILVPPATRPRFGALASVCASHTLAAFVLPAKIGEGAFVVYARDVCGLTAAEGLAALVVSRLLDMASLAISFGVACFALEAVGSFPSIDWFLPAGAALCAGGAAFLALGARGDLLVRFAAWVSRRAMLDRFALGRSLLERAGELALALRRSGGEGRLARAGMVSVPIWLAIFLFCAVLARGLGLPETTTLAEATFGSSMAMLTSLVPISAFANFGTLEAGWVLGFGLLGVPRDLALETGAGLHLVQLANVVALGVLGHLGMALRRR